MKTYGNTQEKRRKNMCDVPPRDLSRVWDGCERVSTPLTQAEEEIEKLREEKAELKKRLDAMTENFRQRTTQLRSYRKVTKEQSRANDISQ